MANKQANFEGASEDATEMGNASTIVGIQPVEEQRTAVAQGQKQGCACGCSGSGSATTNAEYVYALGSIAPRFPNISLEKEFTQAVARGDTKALTDRQTFQAVLLKPENRYIVRRLCWVMSIEGLDTYILTPRDPSDFSLLVDALRPNPAPTDLDVVIGLRGPAVPPEACNGLRLPLVVFDQIYSFDRDSLIKSIPRPEKTPAKEFGPIAEEVLDRVMHVADNAGATDGHRALNYLAVRYPAIYKSAAEAFARNASLTSVDILPSALSGARKIMDIVFCYTNRGTDVVEKFFVRVDVTEEFPFLVTKLSPYYNV